MPTTSMAYCGRGGLRSPLRAGTPSLITLFLCYFFFFFQAEDGIRDLTVTGVQTCALPIYFSRYRSRDLSVRDIIEYYCRRRVYRLGRSPASNGSSGRGDESVHDAGRRRRSEERRVGEEGRSRWAPYH